jgi:hypothetical protein
MSDVVHIIVHRFSIADYDSSDEIIREIVKEWTTTEKGKWVIENSVGSPNIETVSNVETFSKTAYIIAILNKVNATYYNLRWM